jgi:hypothetical protein
MSPTHNWTITGPARSDRPSFVASTTTAILTHAFPKSTRRDWTFIAAPPSYDSSFRFVLCPSPEPGYNWPRANIVIRTARGNGFFLVPPTRTELAIGARWSWTQTSLRSSLNNCLAQTCSAARMRNQKAGSEADRGHFLFADLSLDRFFSAGRNFVFLTGESS